MATTTRLSVTHPYWGAGLIIVILAIILIGFDLGVLARCGGGEGVCFDPATHRTSDGALVAFFVLFVIGVVLIVYTGGESVTTQSPPNNPPVTIVQPAPIAAAPVASPAGQTNINVNPPR
ncbi:MAG TPA: hypothetical protein VGV89_07820 [Thermoplasmata archaeon]|nr:hypothetical protein [Thermoplasmata archaeon]